jgi:hypothetical protein
MAERGGFIRAMDECAGVAEKPHAAGRDATMMTVARRRSGGGMDDMAAWRGGDGDPPPPIPFVMSIIVV